MRDEIVCFLCSWKIFLYCCWHLTWSLKHLHYSLLLCSFPFFFFLTCVCVVNRRYFPFCKSNSGPGAAERCSELRRITNKTLPFFSSYFSIMDSLWCFMKSVCFKSWSICRHLHYVFKCEFVWPTYSVEEVLKRAHTRDCSPDNPNPDNPGLEAKKTRPDPEVKNPGFSGFNYVVKWAFCTQNWDI